MQAHTWILVADGARARIFETNPQDTEHFTEIQDFSNPAAQSHASDLETDNLARFYGGKGEHGAAHSAESREDPFEHAARVFAHDVGAFLDRACAEHRYEKLYMVAPSKFIGAIRKSLDKRTQASVDKEIIKDISGLSEPEIENYVKNALH